MPEKDGEKKDKMYAESHRCKRAIARNCLTKQHTYHVTQ